MRALGVHRVYVLDDQDPFEVPLADRRGSRRANGRASRCPAHDSISTERRGCIHRRGRKDRRTAARRRCSSRAAAGDGHGRAVAAAARSRPAPAAARLQRAGRVEAFTSQLGAAAAEHLPDHAGAARRASTRRAAQRVLARLPQRASAAKAAPYALYGYEAMSVVLDAIRGARLARQRPPDGDRALLCDARPRLGARPLLDRSRRRNDARRATASTACASGRPVFYRASMPASTRRDSRRAAQPAAAGRGRAGSVRLRRPARGRRRRAW